MSGTPADFVPDHWQFVDTRFHGPITDKVAILSSNQGGVCGLFEAQYYKCMEAFGGKLGRLYCDLEYRDFRECLVKQKQLKRIEAMRTERFKQYVRGEREKEFDEYIKWGDVSPDHYKWNFDANAAHS